MNIPESFLRIHKNKYKEHLYDVDFMGFPQLEKYDSFEIHVILYPYSRDINSNHITFNPFEEYSNDVMSNQASAYEKIEKSFSKYFGILLGGLIATIFFFLKPEDLYSVESVVGIFAAYSIGKEIWNDLEKALYRMTNGGKIRYQESYYKYRLDDKATLTNYSYLAKKKRYGKNSILPDYMHFIQLSNSQTLRMFFQNSEFIKKNRSFHLFSITVDEEKITEFEKRGFLFGVKLTINENRHFYTKSTEYFQSIHNYDYGCLDSKSEWNSEKVFFRKVFSIKKIRMFYKTGLKDMGRLFDWQRVSPLIHKKSKKRAGH